jgi:cysteine synthase
MWRQTNGQIDAFVSGAGTGGTIAGVGKYFKSKNEDVKVVLCDPEGSGLYNKVKPRTTALHHILPVRRSSTVSCSMKGKPKE